MNESQQWTIDQTVRSAEREWRRLHVRRADVARLSRDLRDDLTSAATEGVAATELLGTDVRGFARRLADEAGVERVPYEFDRLLLTALVGALPGVAFAYALLYGYISGPTAPPSDEPDIGAVVATYAVLALLVVLSSLLTVWFRLRHLPAMPRTVLAMALLVPLAGAIATPITMAFAATVNYSNALPVLAIECGLVGAALAGAIVLARRWALRDWGSLVEAQPAIQA
ncbi:hypothetical protein Ais01nite_84980 [Asanoa ishikariensis]|uniref:Uncharacterized protein n=1 Tax=Asanoa ishikariensis TaxID=137265 RepID=A0A1H3UZM6_9ACTN|nr:hypothetical protein [Asanoa ishikariensis]GIF70463.1 hypothetical protein Ais01nite_84980 [Asanoa ishikariensis]SDZ67903.1 hypothetical protein SAMN05421684_8545 [Asanoa ishikariensis]